MNTQEIIHTIALTQLNGLSLLNARILYDTVGSASEVYAHRKDILSLIPDASKRLVGAFAQMDNAVQRAEKEMEFVEKKGVKVLTLHDDDYPQRLKECEDAPLLLYYFGTADLNSSHIINIVGTRKCSEYGRELCNAFVADLKRCCPDVVIVSGLALGTDAVAHSTALECGMGTVGVMATGLDRIYPNCHTVLADRIAADPFGALVTDYPTGTAPVALNFIRRNRIIAGLCRATIVVESKRKGGSLITARYAVDYNRDLFALPGRIDDPRSAGCNSLIASGMAEIIADPDELVDKLGLGGIKAMKRQNLGSFLSAKYGAGSAPAVIGMLIKQRRGIDYETLASLSGLSWPEVTSATAILEADGIIITDFLQRCSIKP